MAGFRRTMCAVLLVACLIFTVAARAATRSFHGKASYYGRQQNGRKMTNGKRFNRFALTAACRRLRLGSWARVTYLKTGKCVDVKITDRGPFRHGRVIDLSEAAAAKIGLKRAGVGQVKIEPLN